MAETFGSVIDTIQSQLLGFTSDQPMYGQLAHTIQTTDTAITIDVPVQCMPSGTIEIDDELISVLAWDSASSTVTVPAWGRGQSGSIAKAHLAGAKVTINPRYPRHRVGQVVNSVIQAVCPPLFGVKTGTLTAQPLQWEYPLPAETMSLIRVEYLPFSATQYDWKPLREARIKRDTGTPVLHLNTRAGFLSSAIRYTVATNPVELTDSAQPFTDCGLPASCLDVVQLGCIPRLVTTTELARQQYNRVESSERTMLLPTGSGTTPAKFYYAMYADRLKAEADNLRRMYPITVMRNS